MVKVEGIQSEYKSEPFMVSPQMGAFMVQVIITPVENSGGKPFEVKAKVEPVPEHLGKVAIPIASPSSKVAENKSQYIGTPGERSEFRMTLLRVKQRRIDTTTEYFYTFRDMDGNTLLWSTHRDKRLLTGNEYTVKATVKSHLEQRGVKTTLITRGRVVG